jgi:dihydroorotate dehydrogenase
VLYSLIRPWLFRLDPERAHHLSLNAIALAGRVAPMRALVAAHFAAGSDANPIELFGLRFKNRIGLAAGYDKNGVAVPGLAALGFGHIEVGTVTRIPQPGNPTPRVHRVRETHGVINSMGFPNDGMEALRHRLLQLRARRPRGIVLGVNIGKGKDTPLERAVEDYVELLNAAAPLSDYVAVNISSPNTMNLRALQARDAIEALLRGVMRARDALPFYTPVLVKIAPDLSDSELEDAVGAIRASGADGLIATNTTLSRDGQPAYAKDLKGGLSGAPLTARASAVTAAAVRLLNGALPLISVGGIMTPTDARARLDAGAALVQVYTGLVYAGPGLVRAINAGGISDFKFQIAD